MKFIYVSALMLSTFSAIFIVSHSIGQESVRHIDIVAKRFDFVPGDVTLKKGVPVTISLTSQDVDHGLKFSDFNISLNVKKGQTKEITFTPDKTGTFIGQCSVFCGSGHGGMKMTLHVTE